MILIQLALQAFLFAGCSLKDLLNQPDYTGALLLIRDWNGHILHNRFSKLVGSGIQDWTTVGDIPPTTIRIENAQQEQV